VVFAVIGQARAQGELSPEAEGRVLAGMLRYWALRSTLDNAARCAMRVPKLGRPPRAPLPIYAVN
jgi:hypothetical protein